MRATAARLARPALAVLVLSVASLLTVAAATGALGHRSGRSTASATAAPCAVPTLPGTVVQVHVTDMRSMMRRGSGAGGGSMMGDGSSPGADGGLLSGQDWRWFRPGMMQLTLGTSSVPHGTVSFRVTNDGYLTHELVVLPLPAGQPAGARSSDEGGRVSETGSLGEASADCAAGAGDGIPPGATGWVSLTLPAGRYELVCNLPGHYRAGMFTELQVG